MDVTIHSFRTRLASVYAPVHDSLKASLIESLRDSKVITPTTKSEGDWNCVARPIVDLSRVSGVAGDDAHGASLESVLCSSGLIDAFRLRYGDSAKEWTHLTPSVYKRLDRFYTPAHNSHFTWVQAKADPNFFRDTKYRSDHLAVVAEIEWANERPQVKRTAKIDPRLFTRQDIREEIATIWKAAYSEFPPGIVGQAYPWTIAKQRTREHLIERAAEKSNFQKELAGKQATRAFLFNATASAPPEETNLKSIKSIDEEIEQLHKNRKRSNWSEYVSTLSEEMSSKRFYRQFKARLGHTP